MSLRNQIAFLAALLLATLADAQNPYRLKPGAQGKVCLECHLDIEDELKLASVHSPLRSGECADCHNPHASSHGQLLASDTDTICADCHADVIPDESVSVHQTVIEDGCVTCHDPHAAENANNLLATGNQLCFSCHEAMATDLEAREFQHSPVEDSCLTCHDPHASTKEEFLLKSETGSLCGDCHDAGRSSFINRHMGYPVGQSRCSSCHDPHGSDTSGILLAEVHEPLTRRMCNQCHREAGSADALATKSAGQELCRGCHSSLFNRTLARDRIHWPVGQQDGCLTCHSPHASTEKGLLVEPTKVLCAECHRESVERQETSFAKHTPVADGDCSACHAPHAADNVFLMATANSIEQCATCHDWQSHSSHPIGPGVVDLRNPNLTVDCLSCHRSHGSPFRALSHLDPDGELCVQCHEQLAR